MDWIPYRASSADAVDVTTMKELLHNVCLLLTSRTREIVKAALGFIKVILFIVEPKTLASHATVMVGIDMIETVLRETVVPSFMTAVALRWRESGTSKTT